MISRHGGVDDRQANPGSSGRSTSPTPVDFPAMDGHAPTTRRRASPNGFAAPVRGRCEGNANRSESAVPGHTLLIVEDSAGVRKRIRAAVQRVARIRVVGEAADAATAIALVERHEPDLLTLDLRLANESSGVDVLRHLAPRRHGPRVIVLSTGVAQLRDGRDHLPGVEHVLDKVMDFHRLPDLLAELSGESDD